VPAPRPRRISDIMPKIQNVSLSSNFLVKFVLPRGECRSFLRRKGINDRFISDNVGLLCSDAVLPGSAMASLNTAGDFQGMVEKFAHTRNFTQVNFDFMVDNQYKSLKFLEHWMEFISGRSNGDPSSDTYFFKMAYPTEYKSNDTRIVKFERNHSQFLEYRFIGLFPLSLNSTRVSYQNSQVLKATATFSFDRYVCGESSSLARALGLDLNNAGGRSGNARNINYNDAKALDDIINPNYGGLSLLNEGSQFAVVNGRTITGSDSTIRNNGGQTAYRVI
tara:strand:+ start:348 stop:1181 length:834 start_codon:yes stop_codon:yes gene_type:complete